MSWAQTRCIAEHSRRRLPGHSLLARLDWVVRPCDRVLELARMRVEAQSVAGVERRELPAAAQHMTVRDHKAGSERGRRGIGCDVTFENLARLHHGVCEVAGADVNRRDEVLRHAPTRGRLEPCAYGVLVARTATASEQNDDDHHDACYDEKRRKNRPKTRRRGAAISHDGQCNSEGLGSVGLI